MSSATILVVDDEPQIRRALRTTLVARGYALVEAASGEEALEKLGREHIDLILLDVNMPGLDGFETCHEVRQSRAVPIIMLTVRNAERDKVRALDAGADDYVVKPFAIQELLARVRSALRRSVFAEGALAISSEDLTVDFDRRTVTARGRSVHLTPKEFDVLRELAAAGGKPVSHRRLLQAVWGPEYGDEPGYLRGVINQLRKKLEPDANHPKYILTEPRLGYRFMPP